MDQRKHGQLTKLYECARRGSKGFRDDSVKHHFDTLFGYASKCRIITELGISTACSTLAFLVTDCSRVYSYNVAVSQNANIVKQAADKDGVFFRVISNDSLKTNIKKTDLLYIDTDHWYGQIKSELYHHHSRVRNWIIMNNTETFGLVNPFDGRPGMKAAIYEFLEDNPEWQIKEHFEIGHGLTILERQEKTKMKWWKR